MDSRTVGVPLSDMLAKDFDIDLMTAEQVEQSEKEMQALQRQLRQKITFGIQPELKFENLVSDGVVNKVAMAKLNGDKVQPSLRSIAHPEAQQRTAVRIKDDIQDPKITKNQKQGKKHKVNPNDNQRSISYPTRQRRASIQGPIELAKSLKKDESPFAKPSIDMTA